MFSIADIQNLPRLKVLDLATNNLYGSIEGNIIQVYKTSFVSHTYKCFVYFYLG